MEIPLNHQPTVSNESIADSLGTPNPVPTSGTLSFQFDKEQLEFVLRSFRKEKSSLWSLEKLVVLVNMTALLVGGLFAFVKYINYEWTVQGIEAEATKRPHLQHDFDLKIASTKQPEGDKFGEYKVVYELKLTNQGKKLVSVKNCEMTIYLGTPCKLSSDKAVAKYLNLPSTSGHITWEEQPPITLMDGIGTKRTVSPDEATSIKQGFVLMAQKSQYVSLRCNVWIEGETKPRSFLQWRALDEATKVLKGEERLK